MGENNFSINNLGELKKDLGAVFALRSKYRIIKDEEKELIETLATQYNLPPQILKKVISGLERTEKQKIVDEKIQHLLFLLKGAV
jgi:hypothetical protein